ncbi:MAG: nucleotidyltransferase family protein, partial [Anaerolineaceae bacterium]|nr:nucleotidyltransferase family protein [Anaerolineaceae bacterium]
IPRPKEPLYEETQGGYKAMLEIGGRPMIQWVLDALSGSASIDRVTVVGLPVFTDLNCAKPLTLLPDEGSMLGNLKAGVDELRRINPHVGVILAVSSDIPAITCEMVDWMVAAVQQSDHDIYYNVIKRSVMELRFPNSRRSYTHLKEMEVCGGDLNAVHTSIVDPQNPLYQRVVAARKSTMRQASLLGYDTLLLLLLRRLSLEDAAELVSKRLGIRGRAILCPYPEIGMDVDKPHQFDILRAHLARQKVS